MSVIPSTSGKPKIHDQHVMLARPIPVLPLFPVTGRFPPDNRLREETLQKSLYLRLVLYNKDPHASMVMQTPTRLYDKSSSRRPPRVILGGQNKDW